MKEETWLCRRSLTPAFVNVLKQLAIFLVNGGNTHRKVCRFSIVNQKLPRASESSCDFKHALLFTQNTVSVTSAPDTVARNE